MKNKSYCYSIRSTIYPFVSNGIMIVFFGTFLTYSHMPGYNLTVLVFGFTLLFIGFFLGVFNLFKTKNIKIFS